MTDVGFVSRHAPAGLPPIRKALAVTLAAISSLLLAIPARAVIVPVGEIVLSRCLGANPCQLYMFNSSHDPITLSGDNVDPVWSPDGGRIAFQRELPGSTQFDVWAVNADGSGLTQLTTSSGFDGQPAWSPSGTTIAYVHAPLGGQRHIWLMNVDGSAKRRLTAGRKAEGHPSWSPDGTALAFDGALTGAPDIYTIGANGAGLRRITTSPASDTSPAWSPDGTRIAFSTDRNGQAEIYTIGIDGHALTRVTRDPGSDTSPAWSPDGTQIAFISDRDPDHIANLYGMNADGSDVTQLMNDALADHSPDWFGQRTAPGTQLWASRAGSGAWYGAGVAVAPDGSRVYVTGSTRAGSADVTTYCYNASTGQELWHAVYDGPAGQDDTPVAVALDPSGSMVFVLALDSNVAYATIAYNAITGSRLWTARYTGVGGQEAIPKALAVSTDGTEVFVTGVASTGTNMGDWATVAYSAADGSQLWATRYHGGGTGNPDVVIPADVAVAPDGSRVLVTGFDYNPTTNSQEYATVSYDPRTGAQQWQASYGSLWGASATTLAISPDSSHAYVTGSNTNAFGNNDFATVSYDLVTGVKQWAVTYDGPDANNDRATGIAVDPNGSRVIVVGGSETSSTWQLATVAYQTQDGLQLWASRTDAGNGNTGGIALSPNGERAYITSERSGLFFGVVAYDARNGTQAWRATYVGPQMEDAAFDLAVGPYGTRIFVTGQSWDNFNTSDTATVAYQGG